MNVRVTVITALIVLLATAPIASAHRPATAAERRGMAAALARPGDAVRTCALRRGSYRVSTQNTRIGLVSPAQRRGCRYLPGSQVVRRVSTLRWRVVSIPSDSGAGCTGRRSVDSAYVDLFGGCYTQTVPSYISSNFISTAVETLGAAGHTAVEGTSPRLHGCSYLSVTLDRLECDASIETGTYDYRGNAVPCGVTAIGRVAVVGSSASSIILRTTTTCE